MGSKGGAPKGNRNNAKGRAWFTALDTELKQFEDEARGIKRGMALRRIAKMCIEDALGDDPAVRHVARIEIANRLDGKPKETIDATFTHAIAEELTDAELLDIARASSDGATEETGSPQEPTELH